MLGNFSFKPLVLGGTVAAFAVLASTAGCGGSSGSSGSGSASSADQGTSGISAASPWTTLGTRAAASTAGTAITGNANAKWVDYNPAVLYPGTVTDNNQFITMADGVKLAASVTLPADASGKAIPGKFPVVLTQTGYNKDVGTYVSVLGGPNTYLVEHGYAHVVVDVRGTGRSEGVWTAFGNTEQADYYPTVDWAATQSWSNGSVGLYGASLLGITAMLTAEKQHPAVKAEFPIVPMADGYRDIVFNGGQVNVAFIPLWLSLVTALSIVDPSILQDPAEGIAALLEHVLGAVINFQVPTILDAVVGSPDTAYDGDFWSQRSPIEGAAKIKVPTFIVGGLHDIFQRGEPLLYEALKNDTPTKLLIGPWTHVQAATGEGLPADGVPVLDHIALQWFDQYVKGMSVGADALPNVTQYLWGKDHYATSTDWPNPQASAQRLYLHGDNSLSAAAPAAGETALKILQEPLEGICSPSTAQWTAGLLGFIPLPCFSYDSADENLAQKYETPVMTQDYYINGPIEGDIWISTSAADASIVVRVDDVDASGKAYPLTNGILSADFRLVDSTRSRTLNGTPIQPWHPFTKVSVQPYTNGEVVEVNVEVFPTSAVIQAGHKLRVAVGASDFPHGLPPVPDLIKASVGVLTIYNDATHPSSVVLPVVPTSAIE